MASDKDVVAINVELEWEIIHIFICSFFDIKSNPR
jgi:hypothetical protein